MLVDHQIKRAINEGRLIIDPWDSTMLQPASVDMHLDRFFRTYDGRNNEPIDPRSSDRRTFLTEVKDGNKYVLYPQAFVLASTIERVVIPPNMVGRVEGKSSLGRMGLFVHITAGFMDPGFEGHTTLELFNAAPYPIFLFPGMPICQMGFDYSSGEYDRNGFFIGTPDAANPYSGKYVNQQRGPQESMYYKNFYGDGWH